MAECDIDKANENLVKFIGNTRKIILLTTDIGKDLASRTGDLAAKYSDIPDLLELALIVYDAFDDRQKVNFLLGFLEKSLSVWDKIKRKDASILSDNLSIILPENEYIERIQYAYGHNSTRTIYVSDKMVSNMWLLITGLIHNSIKYVILSRNAKLYNTIMGMDAVNFWNVRF